MKIHLGIFKIIDISSKKLLLFDKNFITVFGEALNILKNISNTKKFEISKKYQYLDNIFLKVLDKNPKMMPDIFFKMFKSSPKTVIKFLSNKSNFFEDLSIILKMPKLTFIKALFY